ncbi:MAG: hypothetical protein HC941_13925 [Microcoleus sp. SU_5_3]|nr:hypothetical protein [Microcoleus sp. SU_5_3]
MPKKSKYTKELLEPIVRESSTLAEVLQKLGLGKTGGNRRNVNQKMQLSTILQMKKKKQKKQK